MKNFSKKLSFVMATAMVVTSLYAPQGAEAATKNKIVEKNSKSAVKRKNIYIGGQVVDFDAVVKGKVVKDSKGTWKSSDSKIASVDKNGKVKARKNGRVTISFKTKATKKTKSVTVKMTIDARTRASKMTLTPSAVVVKEGEKSTVGVNYEISKKIKAAGGKATTYKLFVESSDEKVAKAYVEGNNKIVVEGVAKSATPVSITVYSAQVYKLENAKKVKYKLTEKFDVKVNSKLEAKQTGANKITVMGSDLVASKAAFVIKNSNGVELPIKDHIKLNDAKTEAVLEGDTTQIPVGKYTLTYNNGDTVEFEVVKAVVKRIEIVTSGKAIMGKPETTPSGTNVVRKAYAYYKVFNQFDEDVTKTPLAAKIQVSGSDGANKIQNGKIEFTSTSVNGYQLNLSQISVAIVDTETGVNTQAILTAGESSKIWEVEYKGLFDITKRKFVETITDADKLANYAVLFAAKDQYGAPIASEDSFNQLQVNLISITGVNAGAKKIVTIGEDDYYAFPLKGTQNGLEATADRPGEVTVQSVVTNNGKMGSNKFNVVASTKVDTLTVRAGALGVYEGQDNWLEFTALDANGKEITSWDALRELNDPKYVQNFKMPDASGAQLRFVKKSDGKVGLVYNPGSSVVGSNLDTASVTQILTFVSQTNKFSQANITVSKKRFPVTIVGIASDTARGVTATKANRDFVIKASKVKFQDQYGNLMTADEIKKTGVSYKIGVTLENKNLDNAEGFRPWASSGASVQTQPSYEQTIDLNANGDGNGTEVISFAAIKVGTSATTGSATGVSKVTLQLLNSTGSAPTSSEKKSFEIYNARIKDMSSFAIEDPELRAASNLDTQIHPANPVNIIGNSDLGFKPSVVGYYAGEKIKLVANTGDVDKDDFVVFGAKRRTTGGQDTDLLFAPVPTIDPILKNTVVEKARVRVIIGDGKGTEVEREFSYSNEARKVAATSFDNTTIVVGTSAKTWDSAGNLAKLFGAKITDQYGDDKEITPYITFTDFDAKKDGVTVKDNGTRKTEITITKDVTLTIKLAFPGSSYVFEKVVTLKTS